MGKLSVSKGGHPGARKRETGVAEEVGAAKAVKVIMMAWADRLSIMRGGRSRRVDLVYIFAHRWRDQWLGLCLFRAGELVMQQKTENQ